MKPLLRTDSPTPVRLVVMAFALLASFAAAFTAFAIAPHRPAPRVA